MEDFPKINPNNTTNQGVSKDSSNLTQSLTSESSSNQSLKPQEDLRSTVSKQFSQKNAKIDGVTVNSKQQSTDIERERLRQVSQIENLINELNQGIITQDGKIQLVGFLKDNPNVADYIFFEFLGFIKKLKTRKNLWPTLTKILVDNHIVDNNLDELDENFTNSNSAKSAYDIQNVINALDSLVKSGDLIAALKTGSDTRDTTSEANKEDVENFANIEKFLQSIDDELSKKEKSLKEQVNGAGKNLTASQEFLKKHSGAISWAFGTKKAAKETVEADKEVLSQRKTQLENLEKEREYFDNAKKEIIDIQKRIEVAKKEGKTQELSKLREELVEKSKRLQERVNSTLDGRKFVVSVSYSKVNEAFQKADENFTNTETGLEIALTVDLVALGVASGGAGLVAGGAAATAAGGGIGGAAIGIAAGAGAGAAIEGVAHASIEAVRGTAEAKLGLNDGEGLGNRVLNEGLKGAASGAIDGGLGGIASLAIARKIAKAEEIAKKAGTSFVKTGEKMKFIKKGEGILGVGTGKWLTAGEQMAIPKNTSVWVKEGVKFARVATESGEKLMPLTGFIPVPLGSFLNSLSLEDQDKDSDKKSNDKESEVIKGQSTSNPINESESVEEEKSLGSKNNAKQENVSSEVQVVPSQNVAQQNLNPENVQKEILTEDASGDDGAQSVSNDKLKKDEGDGSQEEATNNSNNLKDVNSDEGVFYVVNKGRENVNSSVNQEESLADGLKGDNSASKAKNTELEDEGGNEGEVINNNANKQILKDDEEDFHVAKKYSNNQDENSSMSQEEKVLNEVLTGLIREFTYTPLHNEESLQDEERQIINHENKLINLDNNKQEIFIEQELSKDKGEQVFRNHEEEINDVKNEILNNVVSEVTELNNVSLKEDFVNNEIVNNNRKILNSRKDKNEVFVLQKLSKEQEESLLKNKEDNVLNDTLNEILNKFTRELQKFEKENFTPKDNDKNQVVNNEVNKLIFDNTDNEEIVISQKLSSDKKENVSKNKEQVVSIILNKKLNVGNDKISDEFTKDNNVSVKEKSDNEISNVDKEKVLEKNLEESARNLNELSYGNQADKILETTNENSKAKKINDKIDNESIKKEDLILALKEEKGLLVILKNLKDYDLREKALLEKILKSRINKYKKIRNKKDLEKLIKERVIETRKMLTIMLVMMLMSQSRDDSNNYKKFIRDIYESFSLEMKRKIDFEKVIKELLSTLSEKNIETYIKNRYNETLKALLLTDN